MDNQAIHPDIRLIALDMDGTLLTNQQEVSKENKEAISRAKEMGIHIVLTTGRNFTTAHPYAEELKLDSYMVTVNGGEIWDPSCELIERNFLQIDDVQRMWELAKQYKTYFWAITPEHIYRKGFPDELDISEHKWLKFGFDVEDDVIRHTLLEELTNRKLQVTNSSPTNLEVNPYGVSKARGLEKVCSRIGITMENVMAMGDSLNDSSMITKAGVGVAMGNAQEKVKEMANWVTATNEDHGVAKAIQHWVFNK
ncbi:Cof-type HAD-IIB family hydrolase [Heyndrickxia oleronia]|uniref:Cof-type HAD-IIB family hydrolase n=1 Tax=Heyndrickxia oleronia TaxID=38875 RepID=UPI00211ED89E